MIIGVFRRYLHTGAFRDMIFKVYIMADDKTGRDSQCSFH